MNVKGEWCYFHKYFSADQCKQILDAGLALPDRDAEVGVSGGGGVSVAPEHRRSKVRFIQTSNPDFTWLFDEMWKLAIRANRDFFGFHLTDLGFMQLAEYRDTYLGEYKRHCDVFWINDNQTHRKLSCIVQLTDPAEYEGGDFEVYETTHRLPAERIRDRGTVVLFPSFTYHAALPVTKGTRYSLASWFDGPKWR